MSKPPWFNHDEDPPIIARPTPRSIGDYSERDWADITHMYLSGDTLDCDENVPFTVEDFLIWADL